MDVEMWNVEKVIPYARNPRKNEAAVDAVAASIKEFGFQQPIVVDAGGVIVCGHTRYKAARRLGMIEVPVHVARNLTPQQAKAYRLADNRLAQIATWDEELLALEVDEIKSQGLNVELLGFTERELNELLEGVGEPGMREPDDIPEAPEIPVTEPGDLWILGEHRLLCGDCTVEADVERVMHGETAALLATDPPYFVDLKKCGKERPGRRGQLKALGSYREIPVEQAAETLRKFLSLGLAHVTRNPAVYVWHAHSRFHLLREIFCELGILPHQTIVWVKPAVLVGHQVYASRHEPCLFGWIEGKRPPLMNGKLPNQVATVWQADLQRSGELSDPEHYCDIWELDWEGSGRSKEKGHPTVKPVEVFAIPMRMHTRPGDVCYEPFCGSGSQVIAAEQFERRCFGIEIEPIYCDVAVRRWEGFTGKKARREKGERAKRAG